MSHTLTDPVLPSSAKGENVGVQDNRPALPPDLLPPPHPHVPKMRGMKLMAVWIGLALGAWGVVAGLGYGLYALIQTLLG